MRKLSSDWVLLLLTKRISDDSERCLELFKRNEKDFLLRYAIMDET